MFTLSVQEPLQHPNLHNYYPKTEYLIIGSFGPLGVRLLGGLKDGSNAMPWFLFVLRVLRQIGLLSRLA